MKNYITNSFSNYYSRYNGLNKKKKYIEDTIDFSRALHQYITIERKKNPNSFLDINQTLNDFDDYSSRLNSKDHGEFILALLGKLLEQNWIKAHILKEKDKNFDNIELSSIQALCSLGSQKKYNIHFDFGEIRNKEIVDDKSEQNNFLEKYKRKIAGILNIDLNRLILRDIRYGTTGTTLSIIDQSR